MAHRPSVTLWVLLLASAGSLMGVFGWQAWNLYFENRRIEQEIGNLRQAIDQQLAEARRGTREPEAPFATWAHLIASIHAAAGRSRLLEMSYQTGDVRVVCGPEGDHSPSLPFRPRLPNRAMTATISGQGSYDQLVAFVHSLSEVDPPLVLDRLEITAGERGPRFEARVHMVTALPVESPRVVSLDGLHPAKEGDDGEESGS